MSLEITKNQIVITNSINECPSSVLEPQLRTFEAKKACCFIIFLFSLVIFSISGIYTRFPVREDLGTYQFM